MGGFNGRVGKRRPPWEMHFGPFRDATTESNENGVLLLNLCTEHDLFIMNNFFKHSQSQINTWYKWKNLDQVSQTDYILVRQKQRLHILGYSKRRHKYRPQPSCDKYTCIYKNSEQKEAHTQL